MSGERLMEGNGPGPEIEGEAKFTPIAGGGPDQQPGIPENKPPEESEEQTIPINNPIVPPQETPPPQPEIPAEELSSETPSVLENPELTPDEIELIAKYRNMKYVGAEVDRNGKPIPILPPEVTQEVITEIEARNRLIEAEREYRQILDRKKEENKRKWEETGEIKEPPPWEEEEFGQGEAHRREGFFLVRILDQMGRQMWVYWPKDEAKARERVRDVVGRIELAREDVDPQLSLEYQRIQSILGSIKARKEFEEGLDKETGKEERLTDPTIINQIKEFNEGLRLEFKGRRTFHQAFFQYETQSSLEAVTKAAVTLMPNDFNALFEIEEISKDGKETPFNPFVEALQFYEDHGSEFARHNSEKLRPYFAQKVILDLQNRFGGKTEDYKWAQNMAERFFRFTGRAVMYDYLVVDKLNDDEFIDEDFIKNGGVVKEQIVKYFDPSVDPITGKPIEGDKIQVSWASGRDGCDYDQSKNLRLREFLRAEGGLRVFPELINGVDGFGGDFFTRTVSPGASFTAYRSGDRLCFPQDYINRAANLDPKEQYLAKLYTEAGILADRRTTNDEDDDNKGERVARLNFRLLQRTKVKEGQAAKIDKQTGEPMYNGYDFKKMGSTPMGLWITRFVNGPEALRNALMGKGDSFLRNPNVESLRALINAFDFQKYSAPEHLRRMAVNFLKFMKNEREEKIGKPKFDRDAIIGAVNDLTGKTDDKKPQFLNVNDRKIVLRKVFGNKFTDLLTTAEQVKDGVLGFFWGIFKYILQQGISDTGK